MRSVLKCGLLLSIFVLAGKASAQTYMFSVESAEYEPVQGGQSLVDEVWDDPELSIPIGFNFEFFSNTIQTLTLRSNFNIISLSDNSISDVFSLFLLFGADMVDRGLLDSIHLSPITRKLEGNTGSRVLTVEWENAGFFGDLFSNGSSTDYVNFQLKLYEANGDIVFHFGPNSVTMPELAYSGYPGTVVGIAQDYNSTFDVVDGEIILLSGDPLDPDVNTDYMPYNLDATIPENTVYRFSREPSGTDGPEVARTVNYFYPNPTTGGLRLETDLAEDLHSPVSVYAHDGMLVKRMESKGPFDLSDLPAGLYELRFQAGETMAGQRVLLVDH